MRVRRQRQGAARRVFGLRRTFFLPPEAAFAFASFDFSAAMLCDDVELQPGQPTRLRPLSVLQKGDIHPYE